MCLQICANTRAGTVAPARFLAYCLFPQQAGRASGDSHPTQAISRPQSAFSQVLALGLHEYVCAGKDVRDESVHVVDRFEGLAMRQGTVQSSPCSCVVAPGRQKGLPPGAPALVPASMMGWARITLPLLLSAMLVPPHICLLVSVAKTIALRRHWRSSHTQPSAVLRPQAHRTHCPSAIAPDIAQHLPPASISFCPRAP